MPLRGDPSRHVGPGVGGAGLVRRLEPVGAAIPGVPARLCTVGPLLTSETRQWTLSAAGKETTASGPAFYSFLRVRPAAAGGYDLSHAGSFAYRFPEERVDVNVNSLAVSAAFGASWFVYLESGVSSEARLALDRELYQAVQGVNTWPQINLYPSLKLE